ncbi:MAG: hypothetical protein JXA82_09535 [Sedimentisphaerales bacterium]|nr:hypothetical protein [Sedimentisphaerales bacterium]
MVIKRWEAWFFLDNDLHTATVCMDIPDELRSACVERITTEPLDDQTGPVSRRRR